MQKLAEKMAAIESLLGWVCVYLEFAPGAMRARRQEWVSEPSPLDPPPHAPQITNPDCNGRCRTCMAYYQAAGKRPECPPEEKWVRERNRVRRQYRVGDVCDSLLRLADENVQMAQAVWAVWVEPWPGSLVSGKRTALGSRTEAIGWDVRMERADLAEAGLEWMAHDVRGDVLAYGEKPDELDNQIRQLAAQGYTQRRIQRELRCDRNKISAVLRGPRVRCG